jgi:hypothetical protein
MLAGCAPNIAQSPGPGPTIVVEFDPGAAVPVVPTPNDLAIDPTTHKIVVPASPTDTPAQTEFNTSYLGTLEGFPFESTASVLVSGAVSPSTVNGTSVIGLDITLAAAGQTAPVPLTPAYDAATNTISIPPPGGGWTRAHQYAIALLAGPGGLAGANGEQVIGSQTWELVSSPNPLVACPGGDLASPDCTLAVDVIPSTQTDPAARLANQLQQALQLEAIRQGYAPIVSQLEASTGLARSQIPIVWTFTIVDAGEMTFDPANGVIPFPNDVLLSNGKVALPNPKTGQPPTLAECLSTTDPTVLLYCGLNTLDGFSTLAPPVSENSATAGALAQGTIDGKTLNAFTAGLARLTSTAPMAEQTTPQFTPCLNCLSSPQANGSPQTSPQQLQWRLDVPLDENTTYGAWVTGNVADDHGKAVIASPVFALVRLTNPLVVDGHSAVNILTDAQAALLEPLRSAMKPFLDGLAANGFARNNLALAWAFTTQSEATQLDSLRAYPAQVPNLPDSPLYVYDATAQYQAIAAQGGISDVASNVGKVLVGVFMAPVAVTGVGGTFDTSTPKPEPVTFTMAIPKAAAPASGYPVTIFGHGFTRSREDFLAIAGALADKSLGPLAQITIASDVIFHGERTTCTGSTAATGKPSDDAACAEPTTQKCNEDPLEGRCVARDPTTRKACTPGAAGDVACGVAGQGACLSTGTCEGGDFLRDDYATLKGTAPQLIPFMRPVISGWNILSLTNFFSTRDNFRQQVIDLAQLVRVLESGGATGLAAQASAGAGATIAFDKTRIGYVGQSLGGILGTLYNAVSPDTTNVALNVPGGALPQIILDAPSFAPERAALLKTLAAQGIEVGTPEFDQFIGIAQWVLDPADPANMAWRLLHTVDVGGGVSAPNASRKAFIQFIEGDETVPNVSNFALLEAADRPFATTPPSFGCSPPLYCYEFTETIDDFNATSAPLADRHGFLLAPPSTMPAGLALTAKAQTQVSTFLALGHLP